MDAQRRDDGRSPSDFDRTSEPHESLRKRWFAAAADDRDWAALLDARVVVDRVELD